MNKIFYLCLLFLVTTWNSIAYASNCNRCYSCDNNRLIEEIIWCKNKYFLFTEQNMYFALQEIPGRPAYYHEHAAIARELQSKINNIKLFPNVHFSQIHACFLLRDQMVDNEASHRFKMYMELAEPGRWDSEETKKRREETRKNDEERTKRKVASCKDCYTENLQKITALYARVYEKCIKEHGFSEAYYQAGLISVTQGDYTKALELLKEAITKADGIKLDAECYHNLGVACLELTAYEDALKYLSNAIEKDPNNKESYFQRSVAYFETGNFDRSLDDYLASEKTNHPFFSMASADFVAAFVSSATLGAAESAQEFVPSLCNTAYGIGSTLWTSATQPVDTVNYLASASCEMGEQLVKHIQSLDTESLNAFKNKCVTGLKSLYERFNELSDKQKGELIGHAVGKYGVEIFAGATAASAVSSLKKLREANRLCNLEAMSTSATKEAVVAAATSHAAERNLYLKNVKYNFDSHNKHLVGHNDYRVGKSIWEHPDPEGLLRRYAGSGRPERGKLGAAGYKESVDFKERIGIWVNKDRTISLPTTRGTIHYGEKGAHIVPSDPNPTIGNR